MKGTTSNLADVAVDTNALEISLPFANYLNDFYDLLNGSVEANGNTNIITGPVRDSQSPGLFAIVSVCRTKDVLLADCPFNDLDMQAFILPTNLRYSGDCNNLFSSNDFFSTNLATLADIEHLTGIRFFPSLTYSNKVDLLSRTPLASTLLVNPDPSPL